MLLVGVTVGVTLKKAVIEKIKSWKIICGQQNRPANVKSWKVEIPGKVPVYVRSKSPAVVSIVSSEQVKYPHCIGYDLWMKPFTIVFFHRRRHKLNIVMWIILIVFILIYHYGLYLSSLVCQIIFF